MQALYSTVLYVTSHYPTSLLTFIVTWFMIVIGKEQRVYSLVITPSCYNPILFYCIELDKSLALEKY